MMESDNSPALIILAGGLGSRFGGDKQVAELARINKSIMELSILDAHQAGVQEVYLIINARVRDTIESRVLPRLPPAINVTLIEQSLTQVPPSFERYCTEREKPWGTGHALLCAKPYIKTPAIVITADDYYGPDAFISLVEHFKHHHSMAMIGYPITHTLSQQGGVNRGICQVSEGKLQSIVEVTDIRQESQALRGNVDQTAINIAPSALASMTCWGILPSLFNALEAGFYDFLENYDNDVKKEYYLPDCIQSCIEKGTEIVWVYQASSPWYGVTYKNELDIVARKIYESRQGR
ncbi:NTP transferase domain-containing protein [Pseudoalteromonas 'SMAR']|uniref:NTP transferase domain-containing protein n=1 Tax=Pseudoalteromonas 'SMAR' TaxID=3416908 RepID=UPI003AF2ECFD